MTLLGKSLVFYLKYMAEMERLYADQEKREEEDLTGLDDVKRVREMARIVGDAACEQAADFLLLSGKGIEGHFTVPGGATLAKKRSRSFVKNNWYWEAEFRVSSVAGGSFWCGAWITAPPIV